MNSPKHQVSREIESGERLLWAGRPRQGILFRASDLFLIPFSLLWAGFAVFWEATVIIGGAPLFFVLWGIPFILFGAYITVGRFFVDAKIRSQTFYGLTDRRIIIISRFLTRKIKSLSLRNLTEISLQDRPDGSGTIIFGPYTPYSFWFSSSSWPSAEKHSPPSFELIENVKQVYGQIRKAQEESS
jgi:hypothetical protein